MRTRRVIAVGTAVAATVLGAAALPADAATANRIDLTVAESLPIGSPGSMIVDTGLEAFGCLGASVDTPTSSVSVSGPVSTFVGTKSFNCTGGTLELSFRASTRDCSTTDRGTWRVTGGTGDFAGAHGGGRLIGTYTGGAGTNCDNTGIDDRYIGVVVTR